jgi:aminoglycoside phosphotransferase (APT) family kinase protein
MHLMTAPDDHPNFEQLVHTIEPHGQLVRAWQLTGGISAHMTALEIRLPDGQHRKLVVRQPNAATLRQNPRAAEAEFHLLQVLQSAAVVTPTPLYLDASGTILGVPCFVMTYIDGEPDYNPPDLTQFARQFAAQLAAIHQVDGTHPALASLPRRTNNLAEKLRERIALLKHVLDEARMHRIITAAANLPQLNPDALLHGDFWAGNALWRDGQLVAVVDWEDAHLGDPLADFAISRLDMAMIFGIPAMQAFTQQYQALMMRLDFTHLPYWDLYAALRAAPNLAAWSEGYPQLGRPDITEHTMRAGHKWFVAQMVDAI